MFLAKTLLSLALIALAVADASPLNRRTRKATLSIAAKLSRRDSLRIVDKDRTRAQSMKQTSHLGKRSGSISATNAVMYYTFEVGVGTPETNFTLLLDTGSSHTFVGVGTQKYAPTRDSIDTGNTVSVSYGSGNWSGEEWLDTVTLGSDLVIKNQSIGVANTSTGFNGVDGIVGVGPVDLTLNKVNNTHTVPTVMDNLFSQGTIEQNVLGVYFTPPSISESQSLGGGEVTFGGYDDSVTTSDVEYVPITKTSPASKYWGIDQSITYGNGSIVLSRTAGIVDTGTTLILIATDAFNAYQHLTGATLDHTTGLLTIQTQKYDKLKSLWFNVGGSSYELTRDAQIWPRSLNAAIGGSADSIYLIVSDIGFPSGHGLDFINGYTFLERYYSVYDTDNARVGFATTQFSDCIFNFPESYS